VIECDPPPSVDVENVAIPPLTVPVPSVVAPSRNVTVPVAAAGETVAVNVTAWPKVDGLRFEPRLVVVLIFVTGLTVCVRTGEVLPL